MQYEEKMKELKAFLESKYSDAHLGEVEIFGDGEKFIAIVFEKCEDWDGLVKKIKSEIQEIGLSEILPWVMIVCLSELREVLCGDCYEV